MRGDRSDAKEGLALREREGTSFPCRSHPNAPQAKPVSLGSIKSTGGVESTSGSIQRFVVKTRRIRRIAPRDTSPTPASALENDVSEIGPEVDSTSNEDDFESRIGVKSGDVEGKVNDISNKRHSEDDSCGGKDSSCRPSEQNGPLDADSDDINHNKREVTTGASSSRGGIGKSYDWFDECEMEEQQWEVIENGIGDDAWTDDEDVEGDLSDAAKFMSSIRKCAKMTEMDERYRSHDSSSECRTKVFAASHDIGASDRAIEDDSGYYSKGVTVKSRYSAGNGTGTDDVSQRAYSKKSPRPRHYSDSNDGEGPLSSISRHSISDNTEPVLPPPYSTGTRSHHKNTTDKTCHGAEASCKGSNSAKYYLKDQIVLPYDRRIGNINYDRDDLKRKRNDITSTRTDTTDKSHVCDHSEELDSDKVVVYSVGDKIRGDELPGHVLRRNNSNSNDRTETDPSDKRVSAKVPQSLDKQNQRKNETGKSFSYDSVRQGRERCSSRESVPSPSSNLEKNQASARNSSTSCTGHSLPKTVTFAKSVKSAVEDYSDDNLDDDAHETDDDVYGDSPGESSDAQLRLAKRCGVSSGKVAGEPYNGNRAKRGVVSIVKHHTVSTAYLDDDTSTIPLPVHRPVQAPGIHYIAPPTNTHHLHPPSMTHPSGSVIGSATSKRRYLSLPLLEPDSSEVDSCSSTDVSPGDSSGLLPTPSGTSTVSYPGTRLLNPGEVYYFAPNSCVVCVERTKLAPTRIQVTPPKSAGLNPNANVFQSKGATTPPEPTSTGGSNSSSDWQENTDQLNNVEAPEGYTFVNGDVSNLPAAGVTFPPTPESPSTMQITATSTPDYTSLNGAPIPNEVLFSGSEAGDENTGILGNIPDDQLRDMLKNQLEYYFSRENLANDSYLVSQMDADQYVPISTVAGFNQVKRMTTNMDLVIEVLRESPNVQVDESGEKVRPLHKRCVVILREVPDTTPIEDVEKLFSGDNCPRFVSCEFAHNNSWYITFDSDEDAQKAYQYLREEVQTFLGKPIMARIKAKPLLRSTFIPKNGYKAGMAPTGPGQASPAVVTQTVTTPAPTFSPTDNQFAAAQQQYTFTQAVPNVPQTTQFIVGQPQPQQQTGAQQQPTPTVTSYPFFPPNNVSAAAAAVMHSWPGNPMPYFDPGTAFAANGYTHAATYKMGTQSRHGFQNMRNRNQTKPHTARQNSGPERQTSQEGAPSSRSHHDVRSASSHDRHQPVSSVSRSSSRGSDIGHSIPVSRRDRGSSSSVDQTHSSVTSSGGGGVSHNTPYSSATTVHSHASPATVATSSAGGAAVAAGESSHPGTTSLTSSASQSASSRQPLMAGGESSLKDQNSQQPPRRSNYRSRRRRDDDGAKTSSRGSTQASAKDPKPSLESPKFDLEATSFPPLPGSTNSTTTGDVFENKMSDVVKGTAKPSTSKPTQSSTTTMSKEATPPPSATPANSTSTSTSQSQSQPKVQQSTQSTATTTVAKATSAAVMATSTSNSSTSQPTAAAVVASSSKGNSASNTNTVTSLPTPPPTPPSQPSKPVASSVSNKKQPEREKEVTSTPDQAPSVAKQEKEPAPSAAGIPKLTYAQMLQRKAAMNEAAANGLATGEPSKESDGNSNPPANGSSAPVMNGLPPSSGSSTNTTSSSSKPAALREQSQTSRALGPPSRSSESFRKDDNGYKDQRMGFFRGDARRAKENRDRRDFRDRDFRDRGFRDRNTDRYRRDSDRYRDDRRREYDSVRTSSK